jgi:hypothetical protein
MLTFRLLRVGVVHILQNQLLRRYRVNTVIWLTFLTIPHSPLTSAFLMGSSQVRSASPARPRPFINKNLRIPKS